MKYLELFQLFRAVSEYLVEKSHTWGQGFVPELLLSFRVPYNCFEIENLADQSPAWA